MSCANSAQNPVGLVTTAEKRNLLPHFMPRSSVNISGTIIVGISRLSSNSQWQQPTLIDASPYIELCFLKAFKDTDRLWRVPGHFEEAIQHFYLGYTRFINTRSSDTYLVVQADKFVSLKQNFKHIRLLTRTVISITTHELIKRRGLSLTIV